MTLQCAAFQTHEIFFSEAGEPDFFFSREPMCLGRHHYELAHRKGFENQFLVSGCIRQYADVGKPCRHVACNLMTLALPKINIDLRMRGKPWRQSCRKNFHDGRCVGNNTDARPYPLRVAP